MELSVSAPPKDYLGGQQLLMLLKAVAFRHCSEGWSIYHLALLFLSILSALHFTKCNLTGIDKAHGAYTIAMIRRDGLRSASLELRILQPALNIMLLPCSQNLRCTWLRSDLIRLQHGSVERHSQCHRHPSALRKNPRLPERCQGRL